MATKQAEKHAKKGDGRDRRSPQDVRLLGRNGNKASKSINYHNDRKPITSEPSTRKHLANGPQGGAAGGTTKLQPARKNSSNNGYTKPSTKPTTYKKYEPKYKPDPRLRIRPDPAIADAPLVLDDIASKPIFEEGRVFMRAYGEKIRVCLPRVGRVMWDGREQERRSAVEESRARLETAPVARARKTGIADLLGPIDPELDRKSKRAHLILDIKVKTAGRSSDNSGASTTADSLYSGLSERRESTSTESSFRTAEVGEPVKINSLHRKTEKEKTKGVDLLSGGSLGSELEDRPSSQYERRSSAVETRIDYEFAPTSVVTRLEERQQEYMVAQVDESPFLIDLGEE